MADQFGKVLGEATQKNEDTRLQFQGGTVGIPRIVTQTQGLGVIDVGIKELLRYKGGAGIFNDDTNATLDSLELDDLNLSDKNLYRVFNSDNIFLTNLSNDRFTIIAETVNIGSVIFR